ncbi:hypothetical protein [Planobispora takensis]|nr:hypothetical protein [Planobispora takensis]
MGLVAPQDIEIVPTTAMGEAVTLLPVHVSRCRLRPAIACPPV